MKKVISFTLLCTLVLPLLSQQAYVSERLSKKWESTAELKVPESVLFDTVRQVIYVSNITGSSTDMDGTGFISKISPEGTIVSLDWITGLNAPKGLGLTGEYLYVSDISRVIKIDIAGGKIAAIIEIPGSQFLNDVVADKNGLVYVSDMRDNAIYLIKDNIAELLLKSDRLTGVNGLYLSGGNLMAGLQDRIVSIDIKTSEVKDYIMNTGGIDGLVSDGNGNYLISDWLGHVHLVNPQKEKIQLLDTTPVNAGAADIDYVISMKLLLVPTFSDNHVVAYELK